MSRARVSSATSVIIALAVTILFLVARPVMSQNDEQDVLKVIRNVAKTTSHTIRVELKY